MNHSKVWIRVLSVVLFAFLGAGCAKETKVSIKADESEKEGPAAALARRIELTYHGPGGKEELRQNIPVIGMSQPVAVPSDRLSETHVEKGGTFEARAYTGDDALVLRGWSTVAPDNGNEVEITMSREQSRALKMGSPLLRRVRLVDAPLERDFVRESGELQSQIEKGGCLELPALKIGSAAGRNAKIVLEGTVKAPSFTVDISLLAADRAESFLQKALALKINPAGDAELELGRDLLEGALFKRPLSLRLRLRSHGYEGCLEVKTRPDLIPVRTQVQFEPGANAAFDGRSLLAKATLVVQNPNLAPALVKLRGVPVGGPGLGTVRPCFRFSNDAVWALQDLTCTGLIELTRVVPPGAGFGVTLFGAYSERYGQAAEFVHHGFRVEWSVTTLLGEGADTQAIDTSTVSNPVP